MVNSEAFIVKFYHVWKQAKRENKIYKLYNLSQHVKIHIHIHIYSSRQSSTEHGKILSSVHSKTEFMGRRSKKELC